MLRKALIISAALCLLLLAVWLVKRQAQGSFSARIQALEAESGQKQKEAQEAMGRAQQLAQETEALKLELQSANERARLAEARLVEARAARVQVERLYAGIRAQSLGPDVLAVPITPQERSQLCQKLKDLGKLPEQFKCP